MPESAPADSPVIDTPQIEDGQAAIAGQEPQTTTGQDDTGGAQSPPDSYVLNVPNYSGDPKELNFYGEMAKESGLPADAASQFLQRATAYQEILQEKTREEWQSQSRHDKEFGGAHFNENLAVAKRGLEQFGSPELTQILEQTGLGNHPAVIRAFYKMGKLLGEDKTLSGGASGGHDAREQFPNTPGLNP